MRHLAIALLILAFAASAGSAHYNMLLPDKPWANKDEKVTFTYQFGHPYEHELFDAPKPVSLVVLTPNGKEETLDIKKILTPFKKEGADGKKVEAWQFDFTPKVRGDYTFVLNTPQIKHDRDKLVQDFVRVTLHVQTQNGWEGGRKVFTTEMSIRPYTRPYGLLPGMVFRGRVVFVDGMNSGLERAGIEWPVEIEKYNSQPPKKLPPDELITFKTKTDRQGFFVTTLPETGWWGITGIEQPPRLQEGKMVHLRTTLWVHVDEKK